MQQVQSLLSRPRVYNNIDGIGEISMGLILLGFLFLFWVQIHSSLQSLWNRSYGSLLCMLAICLAVHYGVKAFKQKITFPRTGFVRYKKLPALWHMLASAIAAAATALLIALVGGHLFEAANTLGICYALCMAAGYGYGVARSVPWKGLVAVALFLSGTIVALLPAAVFQPIVAGSPRAHDPAVRLLAALFPYFLVWTPLFLLSGSISLVLYLHSTHRPVPDAQ